MEDILHFLATFFLGGSVNFSQKKHESYTVETCNEIKEIKGRN